MSEIRTELDRIISQVEEGHSKATAKGATPQSSKTLANLLTAIDTIPKATAPSMQSKSVTPSESAQTVKPDSGYDGLSQVSVGAISKTYVGSSVPKQAAQTITPGTADKTIASGQYLAGAQTIKGDANLVPENIASGVSIFGVAGSFEGSGGGSSGGNVETCTIVFDSKFGDELGCYPAVLTTYESGTYKQVIFHAWTGTRLADVTIENVVCGSAIVLANIGNLKAYTQNSDGFTVSGGVTIVKKDSTKKYIVFQAPTTAGATGTIYFTVQ